MHNGLRNRIEPLERDIQYNKHLAEQVDQETDNTINLGENCENLAATIQQSHTESNIKHQLAQEQLIKLETVLKNTVDSHNLNEPGPSRIFYFRH